MIFKTLSVLIGAWIGNQAALYLIDNGWTRNEIIPPLAFFSSINLLLIAVTIHFENRFYD